VRFGKDGKPIVNDGPFAEAKEIVGGYWLLQVKSKEDALAWIKRIPSDGSEFMVELRQVFEAEDFGEAFTPELRAQEERLRKQTESRAK
jgi:hypothetical protein